MKKTGNVIDAMIEFYAGDAERINHFLKVYGFAKAIGELENLDAGTLEILEVAAVVHDIGIKPALEKYQDASGKNQELEGPPIAEGMLGKLGFNEELIARVSYLVGHHHTYGNIDGMDYQILVEADFLVNIFEGGMKRKEILSVKDKIFKTGAGIKFLEKLYE